MSEAIRKAQAAVNAAFEIEADALSHQYEVLKGETLIKAAQMLAQAPVIGASACGHSGIACMHFAHLMCCIGKAAKFMPPSETVHGGMGFLQPGSVMLLASRGGKTSELLPILDFCLKNGIHVIAVTENRESELARKSELVLPMIVTRETDRYNCQGTTSFTVTAVIFDALQAAMIELMDYRNEQFAAIHPGGAVGQRLNGGQK